MAPSAPPPWGWSSPCGCGCGCRPPLPAVGVGVFALGFENEKLHFDCAGASGSRVNVYKSQHSLTETFGQRLKGEVFDCIGGVRLVPKDIVLLVCLPEAGSASAQASQRHTFAEYEVCIILARVALETQFYAHCLSFSFSLLHSHCHSHCL